MAKNLVIVESPAKAKTIEGYLGKDYTCLLYTSDAADERSSVDLGGRRIIKKQNRQKSETTSLK